MLRDSDENQVAASHQYLTAGSKKIFPEDVHLADGSDSSSAQLRNFRNPHARRREKAVALARIAQRPSVLKDGHKRLALFRASCHRSLLSTRIEFSPHHGSCLPSRLALAVNL